MTGSTVCEHLSQHFTCCIVFYISPYPSECDAVIAFIPASWVADLFFNKGSSNSVVIATDGSSTFGAPVFVLTTLLLFLYNRHDECKYWATVISL